jgi:hypothetical protein
MLIDVLQQGLAIIPQTGFLGIEIVILGQETGDVFLTEPPVAAARDAV